METKSAGLPFTTIANPAAKQITTIVSNVDLVH